MSHPQEFSSVTAVEEQEHLAALEQYELLDTSAEQELDALTELASLTCETPISLISLVSEERRWLKSKIGLNISEIPQYISFCHHTLAQKEVFEVTDASSDSRFKENPLVKSNPNIRFYAGAPLLTKEGKLLGTLCVIDIEPRVLSEEQRVALQVLARQVMMHFELKRIRLERQKEQQQLALAMQQIKEMQRQLNQQKLIFPSHS